MYIRVRQTKWKCLNCAMYILLLYVCLHVSLHVIIYVSILCVRLKEEIEGCAYDNHSVSIIRLTNGTVLYLREVNRYGGSYLLVDWLLEFEYFSFLDF